MQRKADSSRRRTTVPAADTRRLRHLFGCGIVDSFGMSLGWTVVLLAATAHGGLAEAALGNAAMLAGVVLSAPITGWIARRMSGHQLVRLSATTEMVLRAVVLVGVVTAMPVWAIATAIAVMNTAGWVCFAGMRAEVSTVDTSPRSMTRYAVCIAGFEAAGTALAAILPVGTAGYPRGWLLAVLLVVYPASLLPTIITARGVRITPAAGRIAAALTEPPAGRNLQPDAKVQLSAQQRLSSWRPFALCAAVMVISAGPTLLAVPLTEQLYGGAWVAGAAVAFSAGTLLSSTAAATVAKLRVPTAVRWPLWGVGMLAGWTIAPAFAPMVLLAQFAAGLSQTAFEGDMDAQIVAAAKPGSRTQALAYAASVRALGGALCVRLVPMLVVAPAIGLVAGGGVLALGVAGLLAVSLGTGTAASPQRLKVPLVSLDDPRQYPHHVRQDVLR